MARDFKAGDHVEWNSEAGRVRGTIKLTEVGVGEHHGDGHVAHVEGGGDLRTDEPAADDHGGLALRRMLANSQVIIEAAEVAHTLQVAAGNGQSSWRAACGQEQFVEVHNLARRIGHRLVCDVYRADGARQCQLNGVVRVELLAVDEDVFDLLLAGPELLGQRGAMIGQVRFRRDQEDASVLVQFADTFNGRRASQATPDDYVLVPFHGHDDLLVNDGPVTLL